MTKFLNTFTGSTVETDDLHWIKRLRDKKVSPWWKEVVEKEEDKKEVWTAEEIMRREG